jgi:hypothetical protein
MTQSNNTTTINNNNNTTTTTTNNNTTTTNNTNNNNNNTRRRCFRTTKTLLLWLLIAGLVFDRVLFWRVPGEQRDFMEERSSFTSSGTTTAATAGRNKIKTTKNVLIGTASKIRNATLSEDALSSSLHAQTLHNETKSPTTLTSREPAASISNINNNTIPIGDSYGYFDDKTGRLIVVANHTHLFWNKGQLQLCRMLRQMTNTKVIGGESSEIKRSSSRPTTTSTTSSTPLLHMQLDCQARAHDENFGQGNWLTAFYQVRLAAVVAKVDLNLSATKYIQTADGNCCPGCKATTSTSLPSPIILGRIVLGLQEVQRPSPCPHPWKPVPPNTPNFALTK